MMKNRGFVWGNPAERRTSPGGFGAALAFVLGVAVAAPLGLFASRLTPSRSHGKGGNTMATTRVTGPGGAACPFKGCRTRVKTGVPWGTSFASSFTMNWTKDQAFLPSCIR